MPNDRSRSRSLYHPRQRSPTRRRSTSRDRDKHHGHKHSPRAVEPAAKLPLQAKPLSKHDYGDFQALFALYLDVQKQIDILELDDREVRGRWRSFVGKWNRGELSEGWYDPVTKRKAIASFSTSTKTDTSISRRDSPPSKRQKRASPISSHPPSRHILPQDPPSSDEEDIGPAPLPSHAHPSKSGPSIPMHNDLALRDESLLEDRFDAINSLRTHRKLDRHEQKERLEDLVPRSDAGTHERRVEKRADARAVQGSFKEAKDGGEEEVGEGDLMGGDEGVEGYKKAKKEAERKKNEREVRREEVWRARAAEREERLREHRAKEDKTMEFLKVLARQRFGGAGEGGGAGD